MHQMYFRLPAGKGLLTLRVFVFLLVGLWSGKGWGQVSITSIGSSLTQNFNTLSASGASNTWTNNSSIPGWYATQTVYIADNGSSTTGALYSFGTTSNTDRALGALTSGSTTTVQYGIRLINNSGYNISSFTISFKGEQWRQNTNTQSLTFDYAVGATSLTVGTYISNAAFNFTGPKTGAAATLDGNVSGNFSNISANLNITVSVGQEIWLRWTKSGTTSPGLGIDDISITPSGGPTLAPSSTSISGLTYVEGSGPSTPSATFSINGGFLSPASGDVTVTPPANFEVYDGSTWKSSSFTIPYTASTLNTSSIYQIRLKAGLTTGTYTGTVSLSGGSTTSSISVSGSVTSPVITITSPPSLTASGGTYAYGSQVSGTTSAVTTYTIKNSGTASLTLTSPFTLSGINSSEFSVGTPVATTLAPSATTTFTSTFSPVATGSKTAAISITNNSSVSPYIVNLTGTGISNSNSDITSTSSYLYTSNVPYATYQTTAALTTSNSIGAAGFTIRDGAGVNDADNIGTTLTALTISTGGSTAIRTAALFDGSTNVAEVAVNGATSFSFSSLNLTAADNGSKNFELRVTYLTTVTDNQQIAFSITSATANTTGSTFASANAGGAVTSTTGDINRIEVIADRLAFLQQPSTTLTNVDMTPAVTVEARDVNGNRDLDFTTQLKISSTGTLSISPNVAPAVNGLATFSTINHSLPGNSLLLIAQRDGTNDWDVNSTTFSVYAATATISGTLTENNLNGATVSVALSNISFQDATLLVSNFVLNNAPSGVTVASVTYNSSTSATITLAYIGTDFDTNVTNFSVTINSAELSPAVSLTSSNLTISASNETLSVSPTTLTFGDQCLSTSATQMITVTGSELRTGTVSVAALAGYTYSTTLTGTYTPSLSLSQPGGSYSQSIYVQFTPAAAQPYNGNIVVSASSAADAVTVTAGTGITAVVISDNVPANVSVASGSPATFTVKDSVTGAVTSYQWQVSDDGGSTWTSASGGVYTGDQTYTLAISNSLGLTGNQYRCVISGTCGNATSSAAILTVYTIAYIWTNPITATKPSTSNPFTTGDVVASNLTVSGIGAGSGISSNDGKDRYNFNTWNVSSLDATKYFSFTLTPASSYKIDFTSLVYTSQASATGPTTFSLRSSVDNYASNIASPPAAGGTFSLAGSTFQGITTPITFRIYAWGASAAPGTFSINDFTFNGAVTSACALPTAPVANSNISPQTSGMSPSCFASNWSSVAGATGYLLDASLYSTFATATSLATDLFISEYVEGSSNNKYIEIYNGTGAAVDLTKYNLRLFSNGVSSPSADIALTGSLSNGSTIVYKNTYATPYAGTSTINAAVNFNGNDAVALYKTSISAYVDIFGRIGENPGTAWTGGSNTTSGKTLVRKATISTGVKTNPSSGFPTLGSDWDQYNTDDVSHLGSHTFTGTSTPSFVSGYSPKTEGIVMSDNVTGLAVTTNYYYRVRAINGCGNSSNSNVVMVTTTDQTSADYRSKISGNFSNPATWEYDLGCAAGWAQSTVAPGNGNNVIVQSGHTVTLDANQTITSGKTLTVNSGGALVVDDKTVSGGGAFNLSSGGNLSIGSAAGIANTASSGNILLTGTRTYSSGANYTYNCSSAQVTGDGLPATVNALTIAGNVTMSNSVEVSSGLTLSSGKLIFNGKTLTADGTISGIGLLTGSNTSNLIINGSGAFGTINFDQTTDATTNVLESLTLNRTTSGSAILGNKLYITDVLTATAGSFNANNNLTLRSTSIANTARVAPVGTSASISGNVTVERFIPARRAFRLISPTVTTTSSIRDNWMEGVYNNIRPAYSVNRNPIPGYGTHITGKGGLDNFFDETRTNNPSLFKYKIAVQKWDSALNSNSTLAAGDPWRLIVRGDRGTDLSTNTPTPTNTILRATGTLYTGTYTLNTTSTPALASIDTNWSFIGNPYASPVDWEKIAQVDGSLNVIGTGHSLKQSYVTFDPNVGTRGAYVTYTQVGHANTLPGSDVTKKIQSGQGFFVQTTGSGPYLSFLETYKTDSNTRVFRDDQIYVKLGVQLLLSKNPGIGNTADGLFVIFDNNYSSAIGNEDSYKLSNSDENIAINRDGSILTVEGRPIVNQHDSIPLKIWNYRQKNYYLKIEVENFAPGLEAFLRDSYLNNEVLLSGSDTNLIPFSINTDTASYASNRFMIVFRPAEALPLTITSVKAFQKDKGIQLDWTTQAETNIAGYEIEKSEDGIHFQKVMATNAKGNNASVQTYNWFDENAKPGSNYYKIKVLDKSGVYKYSQVVRVDIGSGTTGLTIYPNPVQGSVIGLQFSNMSKGRYSIVLYNNLGQKLYSSRIEHNGGSAAYTLSIGTLVSKGNYKLQVSDGNNVMNKTLICQ